jgi:hypothetical protein
MLRRIRNMLVRERSHEVVAVVVVGLHAQVDAFVIAGFLRCLHEVFGQELVLLVEVVASALASVSNVCSGSTGGGHAPHQSASPADLSIASQVRWRRAASTSPAGPHQSIP